MLPDASGIARSAQVKRRKRDEDGNLIGRSHSNPILDTGLYEVEFEDGQVGTYAANVIAETIYEQLDDEGFAYTLFDSIVDHKRGPDAVSEMTASQSTMGVGFRSVPLAVGSYAFGGKMIVLVGYL
jgi:hypothetical protein